MDDKRKKAKLPVANNSPLVAWILINATGDELGYLNRMAKANDFSLLKDLIKKFEYNNALLVLKYKAKDDGDLRNFRSSKIGEVIALETLIMAAQLAGEEIEHRRKKKNG